MQEIEIWIYAQMVYAQSRICPGEKDAQISLRLWDTNGSPNLGQTTRQSDSQQKKKKKKKKRKKKKKKEKKEKRVSVVQADHRVKLKESEKRDKYLDLARKLKKQINKLWWWWYKVYLERSEQSLKD